MLLFFFFFGSNLKRHISGVDSFIFFDLSSRFSVLDLRNCVNRKVFFLILASNCWKWLETVLPNQSIGNFTRIMKIYNTWHLGIFKGRVEYFKYPLKMRFLGITTQKTLTKEDPRKITYRLVREGCFWPFPAVTSQNQKKNFSVYAISQIENRERRTNFTD
jgi:hypothetical protein